MAQRRRRRRCAQPSRAAHCRALRRAGRARAKRRHGAAAAGSAGGVAHRQDRADPELARQRRSPSAISRIASSSWWRSWTPPIPASAIWKRSSAASPICWSTSKTRRQAGLRAQGSPGVDDLKHDIARTQDALEAVHGTLGHVVDRLAMIEKDIRGEARPRGAADSDRRAQPAGRQGRGPRWSKDAPPPPAPRPRRRRRRQRPPLAAPPPRLRPGACRRPPNCRSIPTCRPISRSSPAPGRRRCTPIRPRALPPRKPPSAAPGPPPRPGGKSSFIAAARRAAQAAVQEPSARAPRAGADRGVRARERLAARQNDEAGQVAVHRGQHHRHRGRVDPDRRQCARSRQFRYQDGGNPGREYRQDRGGDTKRRAGADRQRRRQSARAAETAGNAATGVAAPAAPRSQPRRRWD